MKEGVTWRRRELTALVRGGLQTARELVATKAESTCHPDSAWQQVLEKEAQVEQDREVGLSTLKIWMRRVCCISSILSAWMVAASPPPLDPGEEGCAGAPRHPTGILRFKGT